MATKVILLVACCIGLIAFASAFNVNSFKQGQTGTNNQVDQRSDEDVNGETGVRVGENSKTRFAPHEAMFLNQLRSDITAEQRLKALEAAAVVCKNCIKEHPHDYKTACVPFCILSSITSIFGGH